MPNLAGQGSGFGVGFLGVTHFRVRRSSRRRLRICSASRGPDVSSAAQSMSFFPEFSTCASLPSVAECPNFQKTRVSGAKELRECRGGRDHLSRSFQICLGAFCAWDHFSSTSVYGGPISQRFRRRTPVFGGFSETTRVPTMFASYGEDAASALWVGFSSPRVPRPPRKSNRPWKSIPLCSHIVGFSVVVSCRSGPGCKSGLVSLGQPRPAGARPCLFEFK